jgi:hypothetical protein
MPLTATFAVIGGRRIFVNLAQTNPYIAPSHRGYQSNVAFFLMRAASTNTD